MSNYKKDPIKIVLLVTVICLAITLIAVGVSVYTGPDGKLQQTALMVEAQRISDENEEAQLQYDLEMKAAQQAAQTAPSLNTADELKTDLPRWSAALDQATWTVQDMGSIGLENTRTVTYTRQELMLGGLLLVNPWHSLPSDFSEDGLVSVNTASDYTIQVESSNVKLFPIAYQALADALDGAKAAGLESYIVREGYRSVAEQTELFNARMDKLSGRYSGNQLIERTKKEVNYPGNSDYHTGMTFRMDVYSKTDRELNNQKFQSESAQGAWLTENCWKYGIIFRFPSKDFPNSSWEDKSYKTGVSSQLNMYRFVGKAHSVAMRVMGMCLEEYIEFMISHPHICIYQDEMLKYEVIRIGSAGDRAQFNIPVTNMARNTQASLDNMDGVVIAYEY